MRRGDIWIGSAHGDYTGKPRPQLIVQNDRIGGFESIMVCPISATPTESGPLRALWMHQNETFQFKGKY